VAHGYPPHMSGAEKPLQRDLGLATQLDRLITLSWWRLLREVSTDLGRTSASVLKQLREAGPQRVTLLAANEAVAQPTMSALVQRLERRGLVTRGQDPVDARANLVQITASGVDVLQARQRDRVTWYAQQLADLNAAEQQTVMEALRLMLSALEEPATSD
jgi:DNA-binding MarR family transcriptional regulator